MIQVTKTDEKGKLVPQEGYVKDSWIHLFNPVDSEVAEVVAATGVPELFLKSALDEEEAAHTDREGNCSLFVVDIPVMEEDKDGMVYSTVPFGILITEAHIITVCLRETSLVSDITEGAVRGFCTKDRYQCLLQILYRNATKFLHFLRQIDRTSHRLQAELHRSMKNKELILLLELEKSLVYFSTSLRGNHVLIDKLYRNEHVSSCERCLALLDDVTIENSQAEEMCKIYRDILSGTMDAYASIISNNVNFVMKFLTLITIVLTIPTLIASLWGMNVNVPWQNNEWGFWIVVGIIVVITTVVSVILFNRTNRLK
ncbi:MAG: magnesium transporter CorA family protein [Clostridia bacterium]|nr:magnesium transporter CorA family protein [Clostridia bacterium]